MRLRTQVFVGDKPEAEKITPVIAECFWKPRGGLWTSSLNDEGGQWVEWLKGEGYSLKDERWGGGLWLLEPDEAKVCVIEDPADLWKLHKRYPFRAPEIAGLQSMRILVDWVALSRDYDCVHVPNPWAHRWSRSASRSARAPSWCACRMPAR